MHPDDDTRLATVAEADREYADNVGRQRPDVCWILSDRDVWYRNPCYQGPPVRHPEDPDEDFSREVDWVFDEQPGGGLDRDLDQF